MALLRSGRPPLTAAAVGRKLRWWSVFASHYLTADLRQLPDFVILGTQRGSTTSLYRWLSSHPDVAPALKKEVHYFDDHYQHGFRWYRAHFPLRRRGRTTGEASPYMLFHPLAPKRAAAALPASTKFIVLLREPVDRAVSHYWYWQKLGLYETETFARAIELEPARMAAVEEQVLRGERSVDHVAYSYLSRGVYEPQLRRWFDAVGRDRILVLESEQLNTDPHCSEQVLDWIGLRRWDEPFPLVNGAERTEGEDPELLRRLHEYFEPHNQALFELLGSPLWGADADVPGPR